MGSTDTKFTKPSTDATTTDGFRVGRRVRWEGMDLEGEIIGTSTTREYLWSIRWDDGRKGEYAALHLVLLPEPDAPATPEPADDKILFTKRIDIGNLPEWEPDVSSFPAKDDKPSHYAILREAGHEPWDVMQASYPAEWCLAYNVLTALAYLQRCKLKHPTPDDDIRKAHAHLAEAVAILDSITTSPTN